MNEILRHMLTVFLGFFAIMNPVANTAVFIGLTGEEDRSEQIRVARKALLLSFAIVVLFAILGKAIFELFGISLPALRITGGILIFIIGYHMLHGEGSKLHKPHDETDVDISVSPLAVPVLAGPGTIASAMNFSASGRWAEIVITISMFSLLCVITFISFVFGQRLVSIVGKSGLSIITRLMGLILAVIGVQMLMTGVMNMVHG